ncbi:putative secondary metabolism biosynthetic enzyme [Trichoderma atroviride]|uniref:putative secondary metabolism biosynthetic enzyme n=1 Tax=Hypocrea atroviridis TaxID=63577 RepID=UPI00332A29DE|nr:putative secondary metabolism biosynthetic enzyme [Trichoderma atroviride]
MTSSIINVDYRGRIAVVSINNAKKLNVLSQQQYFELASRMREIATHDEVFITVITAKGRYFSAGFDVGSNPPLPKGEDKIRLHWLQHFLAFNINITDAFATHPKVMVVALNGPVIGLSASLTAFADFVYCVPDTVLFMPFASLGLVTEGGASRALVQRLGAGKAREALLMCKKITSEELLAAGFVNKIFPCSQGEEEKFHRLVFEEIEERLGDQLVGESLIQIKKLINKPEVEAMERQNIAEVFAGVNSLVTGLPQAEFDKISSGRKRFKL